MCQLHLVTCRRRLTLPNFRCRCTATHRIKRTTQRVRWLAADPSGAGILTDGCNRPLLLARSGAESFGLPGPGLLADVDCLCVFQKSPE
eukprot:COSAG06_NODE_4663_length_4054_cov_20.799494_4_plen_89_part_00